MTLVSEKCKVYADIREGFPGRGRQMAVWLSKTTISGNFGGFFFRNIRDKTITITWLHAKLCRPEIRCKMTYNDP